MTVNDMLTTNHTNPSHPTWIGLGFDQALVLPYERSRFRSQAVEILKNLKHYCPFMIKDPRLAYVGEYVCVGVFVRKWTGGCMRGWVYAWVGVYMGGWMRGWAFMPPHLNRFPHTSLTPHTHLTHTSNTPHTHLTRTSPSPSPHTHLHSGCGWS